MAITEIRRLDGRANDGAIVRLEAPCSSSTMRRRSIAVYLTTTLRRSTTGSWMFPCLRARSSPGGHCPRRKAAGGGSGPGPPTLTAELLATRALESRASPDVTDRPTIGKSAWAWTDHLGSPGTCQQERDARKKYGQRRCAGLRRGDQPAPSSQAAYACEAPARRLSTLRGRASLEVSDLSICAAPR